MNIYDFTVLDTKKNEVKLDEYKGKVLLVVNTATGCGFTPQYEALENLYKKYQDKGLVILDFPCNQFGQQAPGTDEEIVSFCQLKYKVSFPQFSKIEVNGENESPLFTYLKENGPEEKYEGLKDQKIHICYGSRKLFHQQDGMVRECHRVHKYQNHSVWRQAWHNARVNSLMISGSAPG